MQKPFFAVSSRSKKSRARRGVMHTAHGDIQTPGFISAATKGTVKSITPERFSQVGIQAVCVNTYHLVMHPGVEILQKAGGIHTLANLDLPVMSDSGGFQVFSLAQNKRKANVFGDEEPLLIKMSEEGVLFRSVYDGQVVHFSPETAMNFQAAIGSDFLMAFDECVYQDATAEYTKKSMERTHRWLKRCIAEREEIKKKNPQDYQHLYGIIQGGGFEELRIESAKYVRNQETDGVAVGGVSVGEGKKEMRDQLEWVSPYLPSDRPVHLLGVGHVDDIVDLVKMGIDTFDCVEPTRHARMGHLYKWSDVQKFLDEDPQATNYRFDINASVYKEDMSLLDESCDCSVCQTVSKSFMHHLFKQKELIAYTYATHHNLYVINKLLKEIQGRIEEGRI